LIRHEEAHFKKSQRVESESSPHHGREVACGCRRGNIHTNVLPRLLFSLSDNIETTPRAHARHLLAEDAYGKLFKLSRNVAYSRMRDVCSLEPTKSHRRNKIGVNTQKLRL
jgi:hypothetical protein